MTMKTGISGRFHKVFVVLVFPDTKSFVDLVPFFYFISSFIGLFSTVAAELDHEGMLTVI